VESSISYPYKYANRQALDLLLRASTDSDEVLIVHGGAVRDTTIANVAFLENGIWITPDTPLLPGTTRKRLIENGFLTAKAIQIDMLDRFDGFALMNAMIGFKVLDIKIITQALKALYKG